MDILRKVPLITFDAGDNIQLKGSSSYRILINGKTSGLVAHNPTDVFKAMPASGIQKIELITIPPAKYDAEGLAGIINIITVKKTEDGYNGSISSRYNNLFGPGGSISLTIKDGKFGLSTNSGFSYQSRLTASSYNTLQTFTPVPSDFVQTAVYGNTNPLYYTSEEFSYEIDSLNLLTATIDYNTINLNGDNNQFANLFGNTGNLLQSYKLYNLNKSDYNGINIGLNYQLGFKHRKDQLLTLSYNYARGLNVQDNNNSIFDRFNYGQPSYMQNNNTFTNEHTFQLDYAQQVKKLNVEAGVKAILRNNSSDFESSNLDSLKNVYVNDPANSNNFNYQQDVYSFYNSYQLNLKNWGFKGGIRIENTIVDANFASENTIVNQNYTNVIPSIAILHKFKSGVSVNFGFTNRIQRPGISNINPFVNKSNPEFISVGNPGLLPVLNHAFELNLSKFAKSSVNISLSYSFANNTIQRVTRLVDTVTYTSYENIGSNKIMAANINYSHPFTKAFTVTLNGRSSYIWLRGNLGTQVYTNSGLQGFTSLNFGYKINDTWRSSLTGTFSSSNVLLQGKSNSYGSSSLSITKDLFKKTGSAFFTASNPLTKYRDVTNYTLDPDFYQTTTNQLPYRSFIIGFNYRFGKLKKALKKNQHGINNDDIKSN